MATISDLIKSERITLLSGPYGTEIAERIGRDVMTRPQKAFGVSTNKYLGPGCSALLVVEGQKYVQEVAGDYLRSVPAGQPLVLVTNSFRLAKQTLESAATIRGVDPNLPAMGLELCLDSMKLAITSLEESGRSRDDTAIVMSIGPPFDCYKGEATPSDIDNKYLPQTFAAVRFGHEIDDLMFETAPSLEAAVGAAKAFKQAHDELDIHRSKANFTRMGTIIYMGDLLEKAARFGDEVVKRLVPSYDPRTKTFASMTPKKGYVISFCLEEDGTLHGWTLNHAIDELYKIIGYDSLFDPVGLGINCNSPEVTKNALESLSSQNRRRIISVHPNASSENNPRRYSEMTRQQAIATDIFAGQVVRLARDYRLSMIGGCCGTDAGVMKALYAGLGGNFLLNIAPNK